MLAWLDAILCIEAPAPLPQVPLLLGLGREERALGAALDSGDADLAHLALLRMQRSMPLQQLLAALAVRPQARALFAAHCARTVSPERTVFFSENL